MLRPARFFALAPPSLRTCHLRNVPLPSVGNLGSRESDQSMDDGLVRSTASLASGVGYDKAP